MPIDTSRARTPRIFFINPPASEILAESSFVGDTTRKFGSRLAGICLLRRKSGETRTGNGGFAVRDSRTLRIMDWICLRVVRAAGANTPPVPSSQDINPAPVAKSRFPTLAGRQ